MCSEAGGPAARAGPPGCVLTERGELRLYWSVDFPVTVLGLSRTGGPFPVTVSLPSAELLITLVPPVLPVTVSGAVIVFSITLTPAVLSVTLTGAVMSLPVQPAVPSPITTGPLLSATCTEAMRLAPQTRSTFAPLARIGPATLAPSMSSAPPASTFTGPPDIRRRGKQDRFTVFDDEFAAKGAYDHFAVFDLTQRGEVRCPSEEPPVALGLVV